LDNPFQVINSELTYRGRAFDVRRDRVRLPDGSATDLDIVDHSGAVTVVPLDDEGRLWFVRQYRHAAGASILELPAGTLEGQEPPEEAAGREIREEIGMAAGRLDLIGGFYLAPGYSTEYMYVYLARELQPDPLQGDHDEFLSVEQHPLAQVQSLIRAGTLQDAKSLAALYLAEPYLNSGSGSPRPA
jgi:ADP-ribose pyrophosphatase